MDFSIIILAAGMGTRMKSETPKVLHKICGEEILFYSIECALELSDDVQIVIFHQAKQIQERCEQRFGKNISFVLQDHHRFPGTGGALLQDGKLLKTKYSRLLILNGDMPLITPSSLQPFFNASPINVGIIKTPHPQGYGRVILKNQSIQKIIEEKDASQKEREICIVNSGVYAFDRKILESYLPKLNNHNAQKEYYLTDIIKLASEDQVKIAGIEVCKEDFSGINDKAQLTDAQEIMLQRLRKKAMEEGVIMHLPHTIYLEKNVKFEGECEIEQGVQLFGQTFIQNSHIKAHSTIRDAQILSSDIGPMAHIRPNSTISHSHIGNFVEVKNSTLEGIKAGHLSYLGDSEIGKGSNIGAGVITCNYDGKEKHQTKIGKNVFIGSDCQLIAPIVIEDHTFIGAGSTIRKNTQEGDLVISRSEQKHFKNGYFAFFKDKKGSK